MLAMSDMDIDIVLNAVRVKGVPLFYGRGQTGSGSTTFRGLPVMMLDDEVQA